jgi:hypothetical protein
MIVLNKPSERTNSLFNLHFLDLHCKEQNPDYNIMSLDPTSFLYIYIKKKYVLGIVLCSGKQPHHHQYRKIFVYKIENFLI